VRTCDRVMSGTRGPAAFRRGIVTKRSGKSKRKRVGPQQIRSSDPLLPSFVPEDSMQPCSQVVWIPAPDQVRGRLCAGMTESWRVFRVVPRHESAPILVLRRRGRGSGRAIPIFFAVIGQAFPVPLLALQAEDARIHRFLKKDWRFPTGSADKWNENRFIFFSGVVLRTTPFFFCPPCQGPQMRPGPFSAFGARVVRYYRSFWFRPYTA
jgi:hypothetical protein